MIGEVLILQNPIVVGLLVGIPTTLLGILAFRRTQRLDKVAAQAAEAQASSAQVQTLVSGLNAMIDRLQDDNKILRTNVEVLTQQYDVLKRSCSDLEKLVAELSVQVNGGPKERK